MSLLDRIKAICDARVTTLVGLERELGFGRGTIRNWDKNSPSIDKLQKVADFFNISTEYLLLGFDKTLFVQLVNYIKNGRSIEQFAKDTGIDENELAKISLGLILEQPSAETVNKIAKNNPIDFLVSSVELFRAAGYPVYEYGYGLNLIDSDVPEAVLTSEEKQLIYSFRILSELEKETVMNLISNLAAIKKANVEQAPTNEVG